jgi:ferrous iron transport protein B
MKLSELKNGDKGVVVKVLGHGAFHKRLVEMGFVKGVPIEVLLNAPLNDPVKYRIMGYDISLRHNEAAKIEIVRGEEKSLIVQSGISTGSTQSSKCDFRLVSNNHLHCESAIEYDAGMSKKGQNCNDVIHVAFVGNPNCGKTSIFNIASGAHERVGNYSGVTVDKKEGSFKMDEYTFKIIDLPGTYSLSAYSPEELYVRKHIIDQTPDVVVNVVDASNLERNLYLTLQLIDMDIPMVIALNMFDELKKSGNSLDYDHLGTMIGVPLIPTTGRTGEGIEKLFHEVIAVYKNNKFRYRHVQVNHGKELESLISQLRTSVCSKISLGDHLSTRFLSIKLLENDADIEQLILKQSDGQSIISLRDKLAKEYFTLTNEDTESAIADAKYGFIQGALREVYQEKNDNERLTTKYIDNVVTHKIWGFPLFFIFMYLMFYMTFNIGQYPMDWIDALVKWLGTLVGTYLPDGPLKGLIIDGIINGVGGVIVFLPNILILYAFISFMEDSGYMARAAFIMDRIMHKMGLHGKSFIPMVMGFGCNIPAIMATRTIEDRRSRLITMLIIPLMSCSARLPVYLILIGAFFPNNAALVLLLIYLVGIIASVIMAKVFSRFIVHGASAPFVMELPPYRLPTIKAIMRHTWEKGKQYLKKMGTIILGASVIVWALSYYPHNEKYTSAAEQQEHSYIGIMGKVIEPILRPCGFDWKQGVSIIAGTAAKEIIASTLGVLYGDESESSTFKDADMDNQTVSSRLSTVIFHHISPLSAVSYMLFILLYMPCIPGIVAIRGESGKWKWALFAMSYTLCLAWLTSFFVFQIGNLFY